MDNITIGAAWTMVLIIDNRQHHEWALSRPWSWWRTVDNTTMGAAWTMVLIVNDGQHAGRRWANHSPASGSGCVAAEMGTWRPYSETTGNAVAPTRHPAHSPPPLMWHWRSDRHGVSAERNHPQPGRRSRAWHGDHQSVTPLPGNDGRPTERQRAACTCVRSARMRTPS